MTAEVPAQPVSTGAGRLIDGRSAVQDIRLVWGEYGQFCHSIPPGRALSGYRMTPADYRRLLLAQGGVCAICGRGNYYADRPAPLSIDHDHVCCEDRKRTCGRCIRGLLCAGCNGLLGEVELWDRQPLDEQWQASALSYLVAHGCDPNTPERRQALLEYHHRRRPSWSALHSCSRCVDADPGRPSLPADAAEEMPRA